jgi:hypothetical protein
MPRLLEVKPGAVRSWSQSGPSIGGNRSISQHDASLWPAEAPPRLLICIGAREGRIHPLLRQPWIVETDPDKADFIIATQRSRCADDKPVVLIDEVKRFDRFTWVYARRQPNGARD